MFRPKRQSGPRVNELEHLSLMVAVAVCLGVLQAKMQEWLPSLPLGGFLNGCLQGFVMVGGIFAALGLLDYCIRRGKPAWFVKWITK